MAAFSPVVDGFELSPAHFAEIVDAVNERRAAAVASGATGLPAAITATGGTVIQIQGNATTKPVHLLIQEMLEALAAADVYVDHGAAVPVGTLYDLASWRSRAGLDAYGFRRATAFTGAAAPTYSYGLIQTGDIAGYWIWEDIVAGLQALQWTRQEAGITTSEYKASTKTGGTIAAAITACDTQWASESWATSDPLQVRGIGVDVSPRYGGGYICSAVAIRAKMGVALSAAAPVDADAEMWYRARIASADWFYDPDVSEDVWTEVESLAVTATDTTVDGTTWNMSDLSTPAASSGISAEGLAGSSAEQVALLKWDFSRA